MTQATKWRGGLIVNKQEIRKALDVIHSAYPNFEITTGKADLWLEIFSTASEEVFTKAIKDHIIAEKYPPTIADIKALIPQKKHNPFEGLVQAEYGMWRKP